MHVPEFNEPIITAGKDGLRVAREACAIDFILVPVEGVSACVYVANVLLMCC